MGRWASLVAYGRSGGEFRPQQSELTVTRGRYEEKANWSLKKRKIRMYEGVMEDRTVCLGFVGIEKSLL